MSRNHIRDLFAVGLLLAATKAVASTTFTWIATNGGSFQAANSWSPIGGPPGTGDTVLLNANASYTMSFAASTSQSYGLTQQQGTVTLAIGAAQTYYVSPNFTLGSASGQTANLVVTSGTLSPQDAGAEFTAPLYIGYSAGSTGNLTITGAGSSFFSYGKQFAIGDAGTGTMTVENNGSATMHNVPCVGFSSTGKGTITVSSGGTFSAPDGIVLGYVGTGTLNVDSGGTFSSAGNVYLPYYIGSPSGTGTVGGTWNQTSGTIAIGGIGTGSLTIINGGTLTVSGTGAGIATTAGTGTLTINAGGTVTTPVITNNGTLNMLGGTLNTASGTGLVNAGAINVTTGPADVYGPVNNTGNGQIINSSGGLLTFHDAVGHTGQEIRTTAGSRTVFLGTVSGTGPYTGTGTVEYDAAFQPGSTPALVSYAGELTLGPASALDVVLGGATAASGYDQLAVTGSAMLNGALNVSLVNGFTPQLGQQFAIVTYGSHSGDFSSFSGLDFGNGYGLMPIPGPDFYSLVVTPVPEPGAMALIGVAVVTAAFRRRPSRR